MPGFLPWLSILIVLRIGHIFLEAMGLLYYELFGVASYLVAALQALVGIIYFAHLEKMMYVSRDGEPATIS